ncbi:MAG: HU family DNA-binding protein [Candidatus Nanopelagicales bacterium]
MIHSELVASIAEKLDVSTKDAAAALSAVTESIVEGLKKDRKVALSGFGTFALSDRPARTGRNPQTGEPVEIKARTAAAFKPATALKDTVNK